MEANFMQAMAVLIACVIAIFSSIAASEPHPDISKSAHKAWLAFAVILAAPGIFHLLTTIYLG